MTSVASNNDGRANGRPQCAPKIFTGGTVSSVRYWIVGYVLDPTDFKVTETRSARTIIARLKMRINSLDGRRGNGGKGGLYRIRQNCLVATIVELEY